MAEGHNRRRIHDGDVARYPLTPYACQDGICEDPDDPLDECNDGIDNDGDGHSDTCDWNCLPHADFGANEFPETASRVENGKTYAMMGGGSICTQLGETWTVEFASMALGLLCDNGCVVRGGGDRGTKLSAYGPVGAVFPLM
jgi:hypothetical protein